MSGTIESVEEHSRYVHRIAIRVMHVSLVFILLNVGYDIFALVRPDLVELRGMSCSTGTTFCGNAKWFGMLQSAIGIFGSILFGTATTIAALYGSRTLNALNNEPITSQTANSTQENERSIFRELFHRYMHTDIKLEALRINRMMEGIFLPQTSPLYESIHQFRSSIRTHMLSRKGLTGVLNVLGMIFLYYNGLAYVLLYAKLVSLERNQIRLLYLMLNVVNPVICLLISYFIVLCDNFNSIIFYSNRVKELIGEQVNEQSAKLVTIKSEVQSFIQCIEKPLISQVISK